MKRALFRRPTRSSPLSAGLPFAAAGITALAGAPGAHAAGRNWGTDVAVQLSYHFGGARPARPGLAVEARYLGMDPTAGGWSSRVGLGARVGLVGLQQLQLLLGPHFGVIRQDAAIGAEMGIGYRLLDGSGLFVQGGPVGELSYLQARMAYGSHRALSLGFGALLQPVGSAGSGAAGPGPEVVPGRPVRRDEARAPLPAAFAPAHTPASADLPDAMARAKAVWVDRARGEWASVPAFLELAEQLVAAQAPRALVQRALAAADEELAHAFIAGGIAARLAGAPLLLGPPAHDERPPASGAAGLQRLVVESWLDGCLNEGTAAACATVEADMATEPAIAAGLRQIARDEARHAELAWDVLAWTLAVGGSATRSTLRQLAPATLPVPPSPRKADEGLTHLGCLPAARTADIAERVRRSSSHRVAALLAA